MMTNRERILAIMDGKSPDRIPWIPRLQLWWLYHRNRGTLPEKYTNWRLRDIERDLGMGNPARDGRVYTTRCRNVDTVVRREGMEIVTEHITPVGTLTSRKKRTPELDQAGIAPLDTERPLKTPEDYDVMMYIAENTEYYPCYEEYLAYEEEIGEDGYPMVVTGESPFYDYLEHLAGYEKGYYDLVDHQDKVEQLFEVMTQKHRKELWPIVAASPARLLRHGAHYDTQITPPRLFEQYITPYIKEFAELLHRHDKVLVHHADNDSRKILRHFADAGYDMVECFTTAPMVNCTLKEAREVWGTSMIIWGGVPSTILEDLVSDEEFEEYMLDLFKTIAPGDAFILGVADNVTGPSKWSRVIRIGELVEEYGSYPIKV